MANEVHLRVQLTFAKSGFSVALDSLVVTANVTGSRAIHNRQTIGTSEEAIVLGEVVPSSGYFACRNLDSTNFVSLKPASGGTVFAIIMPGECALFRWPSTVTAPYAQANTASVDIEYVQLPA
jgi:hypothetical protein